MDDENKNLVDVILNFLQFLIVAVGAAWAYVRFRQEDPLYPRIEFGITGLFYGPEQNKYLAAFTITANNKGNVEHKFSEIRLRILGIKKGEAFTEFKMYPPMTQFPEQILKDVNIVPDKYHYYFVRPGVNQSFNYVTQIGEDIRFIIVRATFKYKRSGELHTAENVFEVRS